MAINKCKICGDNSIRIVRSEQKTRVICSICGNAGKPVNMNDKRIRLLTSKHLRELQSAVDDIAIENWNQDNP